ncbi:hypothetical protein QJS04_geneDACA012411 [Acorus gramineus]|uniref:CBF1-interacting co-repressor CIR N-terminal domain-containing protein n=1 Tax=Acorus gramineus TaxID=55184 RepID=A0AAV9BD19_ACOGR|nr:hypothetical protein QJS04_geneDACA012411 [Acorus gramineus]
MGGHGGLNILPQKKWNVYNFDNREKVRRDEEAAAHEEQAKRDQSRRRDAEFRLDRLRNARGLASSNPNRPSSSSHINLFNTAANGDDAEGAEAEEKPVQKKRKREDEREASKAPMTAEDEKYRLGYGVAGAGVRKPWYLLRPAVSGGDAIEGGDLKKVRDRSVEKGVKKKKKTVEELREERLMREKREKEREREIVLNVVKNESKKSGGFSRPVRWS